MSVPSEFESSLGFQIKYPGDFNQNENSCAKAISRPDIESQGDDKSIVVVLLGWFGADYKNLAKYSEIYLQRGCVVLECITPVSVLTYNKKKLHVVARHVIVTLEEYHLDSKCFFGIRHPIAAAITSLWMLDTFWGFNLLSMNVCYSGERYENPFETEKKTTSEPFPLYDWLPRLCRTRNHAFLFLYSEKDEITPWEQVERIATVLENRGNSVMLVKFEGSRHVAHFRNFPVEYVEDIWLFLQGRMETNDKPAIVWD
ncbi:unnamed protein product [Allacma fusca]|uniref:Transmembrane protein 53 n=1 Tax=Allacma fusca TaxID=39272 RepID=A0A8J2PEN2_9HEXA|nr:unnamed protein product [Allacma fusca]